MKNIETYNFRKDMATNMKTIRKFKKLLYNRVTDTRNKIPYHILNHVDYEGKRWKLNYNYVPVFCPKLKLSYIIIPIQSSYKNSYYKVYFEDNFKDKVDMSRDYKRFYDIV